MPRLISYLLSISLFLAGLAAGLGLAHSTYGAVAEALPLAASAVGGVVILFVVALALMVRRASS